MNDRNITIARFIQVNQLPQIDSHLTAKLYVDNSIDESSFLRIDPNEKLKLDEQDSIFPNATLTSPKTIIEISTKTYIDSLHDENERNRRDVGLAFYDEELDLVKNNQDNDFNDIRLINLDSVSVSTYPSLDNELSIKKHVDDSIAVGTIVTFKQTLENYLKVSIGIDTYKLTKYKKVQLIDTTVIKQGNCLYLLPRWRVIFNDKNNNGVTTNFIRATKTNSPTSQSGATSLPPIGDSFMFIETSSSLSWKVFVSWERTDIIQMSNITFYNNRFWILTNDSLKSMGRFRIQLLLEDNTRSTR